MKTLLIIIGLIYFGFSAGHRNWDIFQWDEASIFWFIAIVVVGVLMISVIKYLDQK
jgi:hypothetical protein